MENAASRLGAREIDPGPSFDGLVDAQIVIVGAEAHQALREKQALQAEISRLEAHNVVLQQQLKLLRDTE